MARDAESAYQAATSFNGEEDSCRSRRGQLAPGPEDPIDVVWTRAHEAASRKTVAHVQADERFEGWAKAISGPVRHVSPEPTERLSRRYFS